MKITKIPITTPPYYLTNNLTSTQQYVAFLTYNQEKLKVNIINKKTKEANQININDQTIPTSIQYLQNNTLVVTTLQGYYFYSENGKEIFHKLINQVENQFNYFIGATLVNAESIGQIYAIGYENKIIFVDCIQPKNEFFGISLENIQPTCLTNYQQYIIFGDDKGQIHNSKCLSLTQVTEVKHLLIQNNKCSILNINVLQRQIQKQILIVCGDYSGKLTLVDLFKWEIQYIINAHIKPIIGLTINQTKEYIITASDDTFVNIWKINQSDKPQLIISQHLKDSLITGITNDYWISSYDNYDLQILDIN